MLIYKNILSQNQTKLSERNKPNTLTTFLSLGWIFSNKEEFWTGLTATIYTGCILQQKSVQHSYTIY